MRNKILLALMLTVCGSSALYAGAMGPESTAVPSFKPFISGEGAYSWPQIDGVHMLLASTGEITTREELQGWGGRFAAGVTRAISERFALSIEGGLMYNDHVNLRSQVDIAGTVIIPSTDIVAANFDQYGFDILGGLVYTRPTYDLFAKAGALFENLRVHGSINAHSLLRNNRRQANFLPEANQVLDLNIAQVMPEIKVGGGYHINENWSVTAAWMYAFGGTFGLGASDVSLATNSTTIGDIVLSMNNPTITSVMFGVQYQFN